MKLNRLTGLLIDFMPFDKEVADRDYRIHSSGHNPLLLPTNTFSRKKLHTQLILITLVYASSIGYELSISPRL